MTPAPSLKLVAAFVVGVALAYAAALVALFHAMDMAWKEQR